MKISYEDNNIKKLLSSEKELIRQYNKKVSDKVYQRLEYLRNVPNLEKVSSQPPYKRHKLTGNYKDYYAIWITEKLRLIFSPLAEHRTSEYNLSDIQEISILKIENYH